MKHTGSCHCKAISFEFEGPEIDSGLKCNCSICVRKGAIMTAFIVDPDEMYIDDKQGLLGHYEFGSGVARHYFCRACGIYPFHQTLRKKDHYRINIGCLENIDSLSIPYEVFDGASL